MGPLTLRLAAMLAAAAAAGNVLGLAVGGPWGLALGWGLFFTGCIVAIPVELRARRREDQREEALWVLSGGDEGPNREIRMAQRILGVTTDGLYGPQSIQAARRAVALNTVTETGFVARVHREQTGERLRRLSSVERWLYYVHAKGRILPARRRSGRKIPVR